MRTRVSRVGFTYFCTLMSPLIVVGYILWVGKLFAAGGSVVSATAQGPLSARFSEHNFGTRQDEVADRLMRALPVSPAWACAWRLVRCCWRTSSPGRAAGFPIPLRGRRWLLQYRPRQRIWFRRRDDRYLPNVAQFVILGAGFDTCASTAERTGAGVRG